MTIEKSYEERLVYMANQIAKNFAPRGEEGAVLATLDHIRKFWDPRMRRRILAYVAAGGAGLDPTTRGALERLSSEPAAKV